MASLATHLSAFLFLFPIGGRRLLCSYSLYLKNPSTYRSKLWYFSEPKWKNLDFYSLLIALPIASLSEIFLFLTFSGHPTYRFAFFQQSLAVFLFWALMILIILKEYVDPAAINEGYVFVFAGIVFLIEYSVIGNGIGGLGGAVYQLLGKLTLVCAGSCLYLGLRPSAFFAEYLLSSGLVFKGTWVLQAGLSLGTDAFALKGCHQLALLQGRENADAKCDLEDDGLRGVALMNLLFVAHAIVIYAATIALFGFLSCNRNLRFGDVNGPLLAQLESDSISMRPGPELELE